MKLEEAPKKPTSSLLALIEGLENECNYLEENSINLKNSVNRIVGIEEKKEVAKETEKSMKTECLVNYFYSQLDRLSKLNIVISDEIHRFNSSIG